MKLEAELLSSVLGAVEVETEAQEWGWPEETAEGTRLLIEP